MPAKIDLSIIIPAYQEAKRIEHTLDALAAFLSTRKLGQVEVIVSVPDSPDGTASLARSKSGLFKNFRVVDAGPKVGKGRDVRTGMMEAMGCYKVFMDADLATPLHHLDEVKRLMDEGGDIAIAVRELSSTHTGLRKIISSLGNLLVQAVLLPGIKDSQCGFKAFSAQSAEEIFRRQTILGWGFDMEILAIARKLGYKIEIIPVPDWDDKPQGTFENEVGSAALATLGELTMIIWRKLTGRYRQKSYDYEPYGA